MSHPVQLYVYDISKGAARAFSSMLIGKQIDGIWHTGLVCFGKEYFFGSGGIESIFPGTTVLGRPDEIITIGETQITEEVFNEYLFEIYPQFSPEKYHLFDHNCNTFSDEAAQFLTGRKIPSHIQDLPKEVLATDFGSMLKDIFESTVSPSADGVIQRFLGNEEENSNNAVSSGELCHDAGTVSSSTSKSVNFRPKPDSQAVIFNEKAGDALNEIRSCLSDIDQSLERQEGGNVAIKDGSRDIVLKHIESLLDDCKTDQVNDAATNAIILLIHLTHDDPCLLVDSAAGVACLQKILSRCTETTFNHAMIIKLLANLTGSVASRKLLNNAGSSSNVMAQVLSFCSSQLLNESHKDCVTSAVATAHNASFGDIPEDSALEMSSALLHLITNDCLDHRTVGLAKRAVVNLCRQNPEVIELANMMGFHSDGS